MNLQHLVIELFSILTLLMLWSLFVERVLLPRNAANRSLIWSTTIYLVVLTPLLILLGRQLPWHMGLLVPDGPVPLIEELAPLKSDDSGLVSPPTLPDKIVQPMVVTAESVMPVTPPPLEIPWKPILLSIWMIGSGYQLMRLLHGSLYLQKILRSSTRFKVDSNIVISDIQLPEIRLSSCVNSPIVAGVLQPKILLPQQLPGNCTSDQLLDVLVHESAHIQRKDHWLRLVQRIAVILYWPHPMIHWVNRRLNQAIEDLCDNHVLTKTNSIEYAETLLFLTQFCQSNPRLKGSLAMLAHPNSLEERISHLLEEARDSRTKSHRKHRFLALTAILGSVLAMASVGLHPQTSFSADPVSQKAVIADTGKVMGKVVRDGKPVADIEVRMMTDVTHTLPIFPLKTKTNSQGEYTFDQVAEGDYRVWAISGNWISRRPGSRGEPAVVKMGQSTKPVDLKLIEGQSLLVKVLSKQTGKPIPKAQVRLTWRTDFERDQFTDDNGMVKIEGLTAETWNLEVGGPGHARQTKPLNMTNRESTDVEFQLDPGANTEGRIVGIDGKPLSGVGVSANAADYQSGQLDYMKTNQDGRYQLSFLPIDQELTVTISKPDFEDVRHPIRLKSGSFVTMQPDIQLKPRVDAGAITGIITDKQGKPIPDVLVKNHGNSSDKIRETRTDANGKYLLTKMYPGNYLHIRAKGYAPQTPSFKAGTEAQPGILNITLEPGYRLHGQVIDEAGKPIPKVRVSWGDYVLLEEISTDSNGKFEFNALPIKVDRFGFRAFGYSSYDLIDPTLDGKKPVIVTLKSIGKINGRAIDAATGKPITRFNVSINFTRDRKEGDISVGLSSNLVEQGEWFNSTTGEFLIKDLVNGMPLQLTLAAEGYRRTVIRRLEVNSKTAKELQEFKLTPKDPKKLGKVAGKLLTMKGKPVVGAQLRLIVATGRKENRQDFPFNWQMIELGQLAHMPEIVQFRQAVSGPDGSFEFDRVPMDVEIELVYWGKGVAPSRLDHLEKLESSTREKLSIKVLDPATIKGTIDLKVFPELGEVMLSGAGKFFHSKLSADRTHFTIEDVPPGDYEVQLYGKAIRTPGSSGFSTPVLGRQAVKVKAGEIREITLSKPDLVK
jgi:beta-lactamase regulating signal transducer with metallopeptidase domain/5-hydroxyisourate hydrolase-like protein (transthyretin family)